jgi:hypothetical protein
MRTTFQIASSALLALAIGTGVAAEKGLAADSSPSGAMMPRGTSPAAGFTLHIDAPKHFPGNPKSVAHHWCRPAEGGISECALFDSDAPNAQLVGVEVVVPTAMWKTFSASEQAQWHSHRTQLQKLSPKLPGMSPEEAKKTLASMTDTYGKVYVLWDPTTSKSPVGQPFVQIIK